MKKNNVKEINEKIQFAKDGDMAAVAWVVKKFDPIVTSTAHFYRRKSGWRGDFNFEDFKQCGKIGVMTAIEKYKFDKGPFYLYCRFWVKHNISRYLHNNLLNVRTPEYKWDDKTYQIPSEQNNLESLVDLHSSPAVDCSQEIYNEKLILLVTDKILKIKKLKYMKVMVMRFGIDGSPPMTLDSIGQVFGLTRERIRQIIAKCVKDLRKDKDIAMLMACP